MAPEPRRWELVQVADDDEFVVQRLRVPGGWLVRTRRKARISSHPILGLAFVPDPTHAWQVD